MTQVGTFIISVWRSPIVIAFCLTNIGWSLLWAGALHLVPCPPWFSAILFFAGLTLCAVHQGKQARITAAMRLPIEHLGPATDLDEAEQTSTISFGERA